MPSVTFALPPGVMLDYGGSSAPTGYLLCDGTAVSRTTYAALFAIIGTTFGAGNGSTTFNLPDSRGRTTIGAGTGSGLTARTLGGTLGAESVNLQHNHRVSNSDQYYNSSGTVVANAGLTTNHNDNSYVIQATQQTGTPVISVNDMYTDKQLSTAQSIMPPSLVATKIIKY